MNRSYSKIRHILEANKSLEQRKLISEENQNNGINSKKDEKDFFINLLNTQRNIEQKGVNFLMFEQDEQTQSGTTEDVELTGEEPEIFDTDDFEEFLDYYMQNFVTKDSTTPNVATENISNTRNNLLSEYNLVEQYNDFMLSDLFNGRFKKWIKKMGKKFKNSDFVDWIDDRFNGDFRQWRKEVARDFKTWLKKMKKWDFYLNKKRQFTKTLYRSKSGGVKIGVWRYLNFGKGKEGSQTEMSSTEEYNPVTKPEDYDTYLANNERVMVKLMNDSSKMRWEELKADVENKAYAVAVLEYFNSTYKEKRWKVVSVGKTKEEFKEEIEKEPENFNVPKEEVKYPSTDFVFPINEASQPNLFKDNESDEANAPLFVEEVKLMCEQIKEYMDGFTAPEGKPKAFLQAYGLEASASRFRNTGRADKLTFLQLSNERIKTAEEIIYRELKNIGVLIDGDTQRTVDVVGSNGDGTSGPNPFVIPGGGYYFVPGGECPMTPYCSRDGQTVCNKKCNRNEFGAPHASKVDYDKYKYIKGWFTIIFNDTIIPEPDETPGTEGEEGEPEYQVIETVKYPVIMWSPPKKPFRIPLIGLKLRWRNVFEVKPRVKGFKGRTGNKPPKKGFDTLACPKF